MQTGDDAFSLTSYLIKPYAVEVPKGGPKGVFNPLNAQLNPICHLLALLGFHNFLHVSRIRVNYRLSRVRRIVENALGLLVSMFRILRKPLIAKPTAEDFTLVRVYLRNCLRRNSAAKQLRSPPGTLDLENTDDGTVIEVEWRREIRNDGGMVKLAKTTRKHWNELRKLEIHSWILTRYISVVQAL